MPREITILAGRELDLQQLADAAEGIVGAAEVREIDAGRALQVITEGGRELVTVYRPRILTTTGEVTRLIPDAPKVELPTWWSDAFAPLGPDGEAGVSIALRLAMALDAVCVIAD